MPLKINPTTGQLDLTGTSSGGTTDITGKDDRIHTRRFVSANRSSNASLANENTTSRKIAMFGDSHGELGAFSFYFQREVSRYPSQTMVGVRTSTSTKEVVGQWVGAWSVLFGVVTQPITQSGGSQGADGPAGYANDLPDTGWIQFGDGSRYYSTSVQFFGVGSFTVSINGGATSSFTLTAGQSYSTTPLAEGTHTYKFTAVGAATAWGAYMYDGNETTGVQMWAFNHTGWTTAQQIANTQNTSILNNVTFDTIILTTGTNDVSAANYNTQMSAWITAIQAIQPHATIVVWFPSQAASHTWIPAAHTFAKAFPLTFSNLALVDAYEVFGQVDASNDFYSLSYDGTHYNTKGQKLNGELMADVILGYESSIHTPVVSDGIVGGQKIYGGTSTAENLELRANYTDQTSGAIQLNGGQVQLFSGNPTFTSAQPVLIQPFPNNVTLNYSFPTVNVLQFNPTVSFQSAANLFGMGSIFTNQAIYTNVSGVAANLSTMRSFYSAFKLQADNAVITGGTNHVDFGGATTVQAVNNGTISGVTFTSFLSQMNLTSTSGASASITSRTGFGMQDLNITGAGTNTATTQIGVDIPSLSAASTNIGVRIAGASNGSLQFTSTAGTSTHGIMFGSSKMDALTYRMAFNTVRYDQNLVISSMNGLLRANGTGAATQAMPGKDYLASNGVERITASETAPTNPQVGDLWLQLTYA